MASSESNSNERGVMRMVVGRPDGPFEHGKADGLSRSDGATLAGLCWKFVKHPGRAGNPRPVVKFIHRCRRSLWYGTLDRLKCLVFSALPAKPDDPPEARRRRRHFGTPGLGARPGAGANPPPPSRLPLLAALRDQLPAQLRSGAPARHLRLL